VPYGHSSGNGLVSDGLAAFPKRHGRAAHSPA
jgi:hypothetical protein